jgi:hypothetical protein
LDQFVFLLLFETEHECSFLGNADRKWAVA